MENLNLTKSWLLEKIKKAINPLPFKESERQEIYNAHNISFESHKLAPHRDSGEIYYMHVFRQVIRLARLMKKYKVASANLICTVLLHDAIEDAEKGKTTRFMVKSQIHLRTNDRVVYCVLSVTKKKDIESREEYLLRIIKSDLWEVFIAKPLDCNDNMITLWATPIEKQMLKVDEVFRHYKAIQKRGIRLVMLHGKDGTLKNPTGWIALINNLHRNLRRNAKKQRERIETELQNKAT